MWRIVVNDKVALSGAQVNSISDMSELIHHVNDNISIDTNAQCNWTVCYTHIILMAHNCCPGSRDVCERLSTVAHDGPYLLLCAGMMFGKRFKTSLHREI